MGMNKIPEYLSNAFYTWGLIVSRHYILAIAFPIITTGLLLIGIIVNGLNWSNDAVYLYVPIHAPSRAERAHFEAAYTFDRTNYFSALREVELKAFMQVLVEPKNNADVMTERIFKAIVKLDSFIYNYSISIDGKIHTLNDLCGAWANQCESSDLVHIYKSKTQPIESLQLQYPYHIQSDGTIYALASQLGGVEKDGNGFIESARVAVLIYYLRTNTDKELSDSKIWLDTLRDEILVYNDPDINVYLFNSQTIEQEIQKNVDLLYPLFAVAFGTLFLFTVLSTVMMDCVRSKPWMAVAGMAASMLSMLSSVGIMAASGLEIASVVGSMPFLIIGEHVTPIK